MRYLILSLMLLAGSLAAQTPVDYNKWQIDDTTFRLRMGVIENYPNTDSTFAVIDNTLLTEGDSVFYNSTSILKTRINKNGVVTVAVEWEGVTYEIRQRPYKLIWLNTQTTNWTDVIPSLSWPEPVKDSTSVTWGFPGFNYSLHKSNGAVAYRLTFLNAFLDSAITLYDQRADSQYIALGSVHEYSFVNIDDSTLLDVPEVDFKKLKQFGKYFSLNFAKQWLQWNGSDTSQAVPVKQRWVKVGGKIYGIEYVMMSHVKQVHEAYPDEDIWHNDVLNLEVGQSSDDAGGQVGSFNTNASSYYIGRLSSTDQMSGFRWDGLTIPPSSSITTVNIELISQTTYTFLPDVTISGDDADDAATFSTEGDFVGRTLTTANEVYTGTWGTWTATLAYFIPNNSTPLNFNSILQEVVDRGSWVSGNAFVILIHNDGVVSNQVVRYRTWDLAAGFYAPKLDITYTTGEPPAAAPQVIIISGS